MNFRSLSRDSGTVCDAAVSTRRPFSGTELAMSSAAESLMTFKLSELYPSNPFCRRLALCE